MHEEEDFHALKLDKMADRLFIGAADKPEIIE